MLCNRVNAPGYKECQGDVQAASAIMDDIQDAVIDYQVGECEVYMALASLNWNTLVDGPATGDI